MEFRLISPAQAKALFEHAGFGADAVQALADLSEAGVVKGHARVIETAAAVGASTLVHDKRMSRDLWKRIVAEGKASEVTPAGTARLPGSGLIGGLPKIDVIGIRFDGGSVRRAAAGHGCSTTMVRPRHTWSEPEIERDESAPCASPPPMSRPKPRPTSAERNPAPVSKPDVLTVSIKEAGAMLGLGRTTIDRLMKQGTLVRTKVGGRTLITVESVRAVAGASA